MDPFFPFFQPPKATAVWQWFHFLQSQVPPGRRVLRLSLDETSVRFWYEPRLGLRRRRGQIPRTGFARKASRAQLRKGFSHIAVICDDTSLQPHLPQVLLVNEHTVTVELKNVGLHCQVAMPNYGVANLLGLTTKSLAELYESLVRFCERARKTARPFYCWMHINVTSPRARLLRAVIMTSGQ